MIWFNEKLKVSRWLNVNDINTSFTYDVIINVSDEYQFDIHQEASKNNIMYYWFPLNECNGDMGINSIYGALQILFMCEESNKSVYLHCHAGANRSPTVAACLHYMLYETHSGEYFEVLNDNIQFGYMLPIKVLENFLKLAKQSFKKEDKSGQLDYCRRKSIW
jgi:protein tyrosine/serine phosphatase